MGFQSRVGFKVTLDSSHGQEVFLGDDPLPPVTKLQVSTIRKEQHSLQRWSHVCYKKKKNLKLNCSPRCQKSVISGI